MALTDEKMTSQYNARVDTKHCPIAGRPCLQSCVCFKPGIVKNGKVFQAPVCTHKLIRHTILPL